MRRNRFLLLLMLALLMIVAGCNTGTQEVYEQNTVPFTIDDVTDILQGYETVGDYIDAVQPTNYSWFFIGEATGETQLTLNNPDGRVVIKFQTEDGTIGNLADGESLEMPPELLDIDATLVSIEWLNEHFEALAVIRGIEVGASKEEVLCSYLRTGNDEDVMYTIQDINPQADESWVAEWVRPYIGGRYFKKGDAGGFYEWDTLVYGWCELNDPDEWKEYYKLEYELNDDTVQSIHLYLEGDEIDDRDEMAE